MSSTNTTQRSWPPHLVVVQSPSVTAGCIAGDQTFLSLDYVADPVTALLALDHLAPDAMLVPTDLVGVSVPALVHGVLQWSEVPVVVVLGQDQNAAEVAANAVAAGCSGLLSMPLTTVEVAALVGRLAGRDARARARGMLNLTGLQIDLDAMRVLSPSGRGATLSSLQFACLVRLARAAPALLSTQELADELGFLGANADKRTQGLIVRLRRRLIEAGCADGLLESVRGNGYRLQA